VLWDRLQQSSIDAVGRVSAKRISEREGRNSVEDVDEGEGDEGDGVARDAEDEMESGVVDVGGRDDGTMLRGGHVHVVPRRPASKDQGNHLGDDNADEGANLEVRVEEAIVEGWTFHCHHSLDGNEKSDHRGQLSAHDEYRRPVFLQLSSLFKSRSSHSEETIVDGDRVAEMPGDE